MKTIRSFRDPEEVASQAAADIAKTLSLLRPYPSRYRIGLSGGTTPQRLYALLAAAPHRSELLRVPVELLFADERAVPPDHPDSNFGMVKRVLLDPLGFDPARVHRMRGEAEDLDTAAREYDALLEEPLDLLVLGIGEDGHTASLFPGSPALDEATRRVVTIVGPKPPPRRLTITPRVIREARRVMVLATGASKAHAVALAIAVGNDPRAVPASLARQGDWYLDAAAASGLPAALVAVNEEGPGESPGRPSKN